MTVFVESVQLYSLVKSELDTLKLKEKELVEELNTYKDKVTVFSTVVFTLQYRSEQCNTDICIALFYSTENRIMIQ